MDSVSNSSTAAAAAAASGLDNMADGHWRRGKAAENFTALVMKIAASDPTRSLTDARKALIQKRLHQLDLHTPNHPPYAAMIQRAIAELKEPEGSTEESISEFIRKHYDDLPWAHLTLIKHHLRKLCQSDDIVVTSDNCYLLAGGVTNLNSGHSSRPKREHIQQKQKQKQPGKKISGRARRRRKDQIKEQTQQGEQMEGIHGQNQVQEEQNITEEPQSELTGELKVPQAREQEKQIALIEEQNHLEGQILESEHQELNQPEVPSLQLVEQEQQPEFSNSERLLELCAEQEACKFLPMISTTSLSLPLNSEPPEQCKQELPNSVRSSEIKMSIEVEEDEFSQTRPLKLKEWRQLRCQNRSQSKYEKPTAATTMQLLLLEDRQQLQQQTQLSGLEGLQVLKSLEKLSEMKQKQGKQHGQTKHAKSRPEEIITQDIPKNSNQQLPNTRKSRGSKLATVVPSLEEQLQQGQLCEGKKALKSELPTMTVSHSLPEELALVTVEQSSQTDQLQPRLRQHGERMRTRSMSKRMGTQDAPMSSEKLAGLLNLPTMTVSHSLPEELALVTVEQSSQTDQLQPRVRQHGERMRTRSMSKTMGTQDAPMSSEKLAGLLNPEQCLRPGIRTGEYSEWQKAPQSLLAEMTPALDFHTPNHPPYAAMIHRAIAELKEPEGSAEESISEFIRKLHDDLPWAHLTLLKHHLQKLCECGEIVVTSNNCYLLAGGVTNLNSGHSSSPKRVQKRKQPGKKISGRAKSRRKNQIKEKAQQGEQMEAIHGQNQVQEEENIGEEPHSEIIDGSNVLQAPEQEQQIVLVEEQNQLDGKILDSAHQELNQLEVPGPHLLDQEQQPESCNSERPLELCAMEEAYDFLPSTSTTSLSLSMESETHVHCKLELPSSRRYTEVKMSREAEENEFSHMQSKFSHTLRRQLRCQSRRQSKYEKPTTATMTQLLLLEFNQQQRQVLGLDGLQVLNSVEKLPEMKQKQAKQHGRRKIAKSRPEEVKTQDSNQRHPNTRKSQGSKLATMLPSLEEQWQQGQLCEGKKALKSELPTMTVSHILPEELALVTVVQSSQTEQLQPRVRQHGERKRTRSMSKRMGTQDAPMNSEKLALAEVSAALDLSSKDPNQQPDVSVSEGPVELNQATIAQSSQTDKRGRQLRRLGGKTSTSRPPIASKTDLLPCSEIRYQEPEVPNEVLVEELTRTTKQQAKRHGQRNQVTKRVTDHNMSMARQQSDREQPPELPSPERTQKLEHQQTQEKSQCRQLRPRPPKPEQLTTTTTGKRQHEEQEQQTPTEESTQHQRKKPKVSGQKNLLSSKTRTKAGSLDSRLASQQQPGQQPVFPNSGRAKEVEYKQTQEKAQHRHLRARRPKSKEAAATTTTEMVALQDQHEQQGQLDCQDGARLLEHKLDMTLVVVESSPSYRQVQHEQQLAPRGSGRTRKDLHSPQPQQQEQTNRRGRGRHLKPKPDETTTENVSSSEKQLQEHKR